MIVFVASASLDSVWVVALRRVLKNGDDAAWRVVEPLAVHPHWQEYARRAISLADALLFVTSPRSIASPHCAWELATALGMGKPCFQWVVEPVDGQHEASLLPVLKVGGVEDAPQWRFQAPSSGD